jgi:phosphoribosylamine--glycine ligase
VLFLGLMLTAKGPELIEYNCRFGDPECQVMLMRLESDLGELLLACAEGRLDSIPAPRFSSDTALTVVMAAAGYPDTPKKGGVIAGIEAAEAAGARVFHAGTALKDGVLVASGGRVLNVTARGASVSAAQAKAYAAVDALDAPDLFCRRDIGWREVAREQGQE